MTEVKDFAEIGERVFRLYHRNLSDRKDEENSMIFARILGFAMGFTEQEIKADKAEHEKAEQGIRNVLLNLSEAFKNEED